MVKRSIGGVLLILTLLFALVSSEGQTLITDQQITMKTLLDEAIYRLGFALESAALGTIAPTARNFTNNACSVLATIEGRGNPTVAHVGCSPSNTLDTIGLKSYVAQIKARVEQMGLGDANIGLTFRNMETYLNKASDMTRDAINKIASSEAKLDETKVDMQIVLALLSAVKGRPDDTFSYGGLLTILAKVGK